MALGKTRRAVASRARPIIIDYRRRTKQNLSRVGHIAPLLATLRLPSVALRFRSACIQQAFVDLLDPLTCRIPREPAVDEIYSAGSEAAQGGIFTQAQERGSQVLALASFE